MARLTLTLLGGFEARLDADRALRLSIKKGQALLAYLAMPAGRPHLRDKLATLLWGDLPELSARKGLRQTLFTLGRLLGEANPLRVAGEAVALELALVATDVAELEGCAAEGTRPALERAAGLYRGDLLKGLTVREPGFEEWLVGERRRLRELALDTMARLLAQQREAGALEPAVQTALRLVALDPVREPVHRTLMRLHMQLGRRAEALRRYQLCVSALSRELRAEPEAETKALYREILQRELVPPTVAAPPNVGAVPSAPRGPLPAIASPPPESPLVAREIELGQLRDALETAWAGQGRIVSVIGEAGIGKSRLVAELAVEAARRGGRSLVGRCHESEQVLPFGPWIDAFRSSGLADEREIMGALDAAWRAELARLLPEIADAPPRPPAADAAQLFEAVAQLLDRVAQPHPVLLVIEDLHWADEMSLRLLAFIGRRLGGWRMLAVVTAREENLPESTLLRHTLGELEQGGHLARCALGPLGREDTRALTRTLIPSSDAARLDEQLWRASEGNPFVVVETVRALPGGRALGGGPAPEGGPVLPLPERVRKLIASRIGRLGERTRRVAAVAAVIGRPFDFALLERAVDLGEAETAEGVEELVRHRFFQGGDEGFEFTHDRIREVVYGELLAPLRAPIHRRVAEALELLPAGEPGRSALALGTHYREGQVWAKAAFYLTQAALEAVQRYAQRDAVVCYEQALAASTRLPDTRETREQAADLRLGLVHSLYLTGQFARAMAHVREAEDLVLALGDHRRLGEVYASLAFLLGAEGDLASAARTGLRAFTIASSLGHPDLEVWTNMGLARVYYAQGDLRRAIECLRRVAGIQMTGALEDVPSNERFGRGTLMPSVASRAWVALCLAGTGDFAEALAWGREGVRMAEELNSPHEQIWATFCLSRVHLARGDAEQAIPLLEKAMPQSEGRIPLYWPRVVAALGRALTMIGRPEAALPLLDRALAEEQAIKLNFRRTMPLRWTAAAHLEAGHLAEADRYASAALDVARQQGGRGDEAWALHVLGEIAARGEPPRLDLALEHSQQALTLAEELGMNPLQARCHLILGALHQRQGGLTEARAELSQAVEMLRRMQMRYWLRIAEPLLAAIAVPTA